MKTLDPVDLATVCGGFAPPNDGGSIRLHDDGSLQQFMEQFAQAQEAAAFRMFMGSPVN
jgi:hypothetical protein